MTIKSRTGIVLKINFLIFHQFRFLVRDIKNRDVKVMIKY